MSRIGLLVAPGRNRELLEQALRGSGHEVSLVTANDTATNDTTALHTAARTRRPAPDLVVADPRTFTGCLPDGYDAVPTVLLVRATERRALPARVLSAADEVITVPVPQRELVERISRLAMQHSRAAEERRQIKGHVAHINHELRTPLQAVLAFTELLDDDSLDPERARHVSHIATGGQRMLNLVNEMLDFSRAEAGRLELRFTPVDMTAAVGTAVATVRPLADRRGLVLLVRETSDRPTGLPPVRADAVRLDQILLNLLSNAVKYNSEDGRIDVAFRELDGEVAVDITDTGPGMDACDIKRIFVPYERLAGAMGTSGTGLGLPYAKLLAEHMGGRLEVSSTPGRGSTFSLVLPKAG